MEKLHIPRSSIATVLVEELRAKHHVVWLKGLRSVTGAILKGDQCAKMMLVESNAPCPNLACDIYSRYM